MLIAIIFWIIGLVVTSFTLISALICFAFGIPATKKLKRANMLVDNHSIIKRYWISISILVIVFVVSLGLIYVFGSVHALRGYISGIIFAFIFGIGKIGRNKNNIADYIDTQGRYFNKPAEDVVNFLMK